MAMILKGWSLAIVVGVLLSSNVILLAGHALLAQTLPSQPDVPTSTETVPSTWPVLRVGDTGDAVRQLQAELSRIGVYDAPADGIYGANTEAAVRQFQRRQGLTPDGVVGAQTWQALALAQSGLGIFDPQIFSRDDLLVFTPLTFSQPAPPPSPFWLVLMPLVPLIGGGLTYLQRRAQGRHPIKGAKTQRRKRRRRKRKTHPGP